MYENTLRHLARPGKHIMLSTALKSLRGRLIAPYQHDGVAWMLKRETVDQTRGGFLCDEMGLGKTIQVSARP